MTKPAESFSSEHQWPMDKAALAVFLDSLGHCGEVVSLFIKPRPAVSVSGSQEQRLQEFLQRAGALAEQTLMGPVDADDVQYAMLNRLEFEGSLVGVLRGGGCHGSNRHLSLAELRKQVAEMLEAVFPEPFSALWVYRFDRMDWCEWMRAATDCAGYLAWQPERDLWWLLCVCEED